VAITFQSLMLDSNQGLYIPRFSLILSWRKTKELPLEIVSQAPMTSHKNPLIPTHSDINPKKFKHKNARIFSNRS